MQAIYRSREEFGDLRDPGNRTRLAQSIVGKRATLFYDLGLDPQEMIEEIVAGPPTLGSALGAVFRAYARRFGKPRWGDKRPAYYEFIPELLRLFPDAQIIHLIRDGRDCVASLKTMPWFQQDIHAAVCTWMEATARVRRAARHLPPGTVFELRYEDLVADPAHQLGVLCEFLGEEYDPAMAEPGKIARATIPQRKTWHQDTQQQVTTARTGLWRERLEPWEAALCETVMSRRLRSLGYALSGAGHPPPADLARFARTAALRRGAAGKRDLREWLARTRDSGPVECLL